MTQRKSWRVTLADKGNHGAPVTVFDGIESREFKVGADGVVSTDEAGAALLLRAFGDSTVDAPPAAEATDPALAAATDTPPAEAGAQASEGAATS